MRITWKREARGSGLVGVCQGPRGYYLNIDGKRVANVGWAKIECKAYVVQCLTKEE